MKLSFEFRNLKIEFNFKNLVLSFLFLENNLRDCTCFGLFSSIMSNYEVTRWIHLFYRYILLLSYPSHFWYIRADLMPSTNYSYVKSAGAKNTHSHSYFPWKYKVHKKYIHQKVQSTRWLIQHYAFFFFDNLQYWC